MKHLLATYGYPALFFLAVLETACIPIPSEVVLLTAGLLAGTHKLSLPAAIVIAFVGEMIGGFIGWGLGRTGGRTLVERYGKWVLIGKRDIDRVERFFSRTGVVSVMVCRMLPVLRAFISLAAGMFKVRARTFAVLSAIGSALWITAIALLGYEVGSHLQSQIDQVLHGLGYGLVALVVVLGALFVLHRVRERRALTAED